MTDLERAAQVCEDLRVGHDPRLVVPGDEYYRKCAAAIRALSPAQPEGWVSVPREPTQAMLSEMTRPNHSYKVRYQRMLAVAPPAPGAREQDAAAQEKRERGTVAEATTMPAPAAPVLPEEPPEVMMADIDFSYRNVTALQQYAIALRRIAQEAHVALTTRNQAHVDNYDRLIKQRDEAVARAARLQAELAEAKRTVSALRAELKRKNLCL